jgi:hypothetical protein
MNIQVSYISRAKLSIIYAFHQLSLYPTIHLSYTNAFATRNRSNVLSHRVAFASQCIFGNTQVGSFEDAQVSRELIASFDAANISGHHHTLWNVQTKFKSKYEAHHPVPPNLIRSSSCQMHWLVTTHAKWCDVIYRFSTEGHNAPLTASAKEKRTYTCKQTPFHARGPGGIE